MFYWWQCSCAVCGMGGFFSWIFLKSSISMTNSENKNKRRRLITSSSTKAVTQKKVTVLPKLAEPSYHLVPARLKSTQTRWTFEEVDNPCNWPPHCHRPKFVENGKYKHHCLPTGAVPAPVDEETGKRELEGHEFFYNCEFKQENWMADGRVASDENLHCPCRTCLLLQLHALVLLLGNATAQATADGGGCSSVDHP